MTRAIVTAVAVLSAIVGIGAVYGPTSVSGHASVAYVQCAEEDGSGDQVMPCRWDGGSNGGRAYLLTMVGGSVDV